ncbi:MAG: hypothetical protein LDL56_04340 [Armatimonadetes bacterium]|nr:hypothetical protein [Armatimonadota bacterium]
MAKSEKAAPPKPEAPKVDRLAPAPAQSVKVVMATAELQSRAGRLNRLKALARQNRDVAWLMGLVDPKKLT